MNDIINKLAIYFEHITTAEITVLFSALAMASLICHFLRIQLSYIKDASFFTSMLQTSRSLLYSAVFLCVSLLTQIIFLHVYKTANLMLVSTSLLAAWFTSILIYLITDKKLSTWLIFLIIIPITILHLLGSWHEVQQYLSSITFSMGSFSASLYRVLKSIIVLVILFSTVRVLIHAIDKHLNKSKSFKRNERMLVIQMAKALSYLGVIIISLQIVGIDLTVFAIFGGAIGVGIGFGLQKITANFISGFILLFEKTLKVNDLIELGNGVLGYVRFTGARHTLIETYTGKEIMIPNEVFITQNVTNWTHSHKKARLDIKIGVAYDSDLKLVKAIMLEAAREHPRSSKDPAPSCYLEEFGESSVDFGLYFWVDDITEGRKTPKNDVLFSIWEKFKTHNITIPFPQRDVHVHTN